MGASFRWWIASALGLGALALESERGAHAERQAELQPAPDRHRVECFELRATAAGPAVGYAALHRTDTDGETLLEWQIRFPAAELRVWHAETLGRGGQRWIWREAGPRAGRSVSAERTEGAVEVTEWGRTNVRRERLPVGSACAFPLELEERLRAGEFVPGELALFDPLANAVESVRLELESAPPGAGDGLRRASLVRADGSLAGSWAFHGTELVSFAWQRGGLIAVRTDRERIAEQSAPAERPEPARAVSSSGR